MDFPGEFVEESLIDLLFCKIERLDVMVFIYRPKKTDHRTRSSFVMLWFCLLQNKEIGKKQKKILFYLCFVLFNSGFDLRSLFLADTYTTKRRKRKEKEVSCFTCK